MKIASVLIFILVCVTSCLILPPGEEADIALSYSPNPSYDCYYSSSDGWVWTADIKIKENNGVSVNLGGYGPNGACCVTKVYSNGALLGTYYSDNSEVEEWFGTLFIGAYGTIAEYDAKFYLGNNPDGYIVETYYGEDENGNKVSCTNTIYLENQNKGTR